MGLALKLESEAEREQREQGYAEQARKSRRRDFIIIGFIVLFILVVSSPQLLSRLHVG